MDSSFLRRRAFPSLILQALLLGGLPGCDSNVEPFDPNEQVRQPNLSKIFPEGAQRVPRKAEEIAASDRPPGARERPTSPPIAAAPELPIRGTIRVAPELVAKIPSQGIVFLIARNGPAGPPLAVKTLPVDGFPRNFEIGPANRMIPDMPFTGSIRLTVRIDGDGNASSKNPGDLVGELAEPVAPGTDGVEILVDTLL